MTYNFDEVVNRSSHDAAKYDERKKNFGSDEVLPFWVADMDFQVAQPILDAMKEKVEQGMFGYVARCEDYFTSIVRWQKKRYNWTIEDPSLMSFAVGVIPSMAALVQQFADVGEKVLVQSPVYSAFFDVVEKQGRVLLDNALVEKDGYFHLDLLDFEEKLKQGPKCFLLCNPQNPVGHAWTFDELKAMGELCCKYGVTIISDEIHGDLTLFGNRHIPMATVSQKIADMTITCTACSKSFNLAGLQASTVIFNNKREKEVYDRFWKNLEIHRNNSFSLVASIAAMNQGEAWLEQVCQYIEGNMRYVEGFLKEHLPQITVQMPETTYLMWINFRGLGMDHGQLQEFLLKKAKIALSSGTSFGPNLEGYMRLNVACPRKLLEQGMEQLLKAVQEK